MSISSLSPVSFFQHAERITSKVCNTCGLTQLTNKIKLFVLSIFHQKQNHSFLSHKDTGVPQDIYAHLFKFAPVSVLLDNFDPSTVVHALNQMKCASEYPYNFANSVGDAHKFLDRLGPNARNLTVFKGPIESQACTGFGLVDTIKCIAVMLGICRPPVLSRLSPDTKILSIFESQPIYSDRYLVITDLSRFSQLTQLDLGENCPDIYFRSIPPSLKELTIGEKSHWIYYANSPFAHLDNLKKLTIKTFLDDVVVRDKMIPNSLEELVIASSRIYARTINQLVSPLQNLRKLTFNDCRVIGFLDQLPVSLEEIRFQKRSYSPIIATELSRLNNLKICEMDYISASDIKLPSSLETLVISGEGTWDFSNLCKLSTLVLHKNNSRYKRLSNLPVSIETLSVNIGEYHVDAGVRKRTTGAEITHFSDLNNVQKIELNYNWSCMLEENPFNELLYFPRLQELCINAKMTDNFKEAAIKYAQSNNILLRCNNSILVERV